MKNEIGKYTKGEISVGNTGYFTWLMDKKGRYLFEVVTHDSEGSFVKNEDERAANASRVETLWNNHVGIPGEEIGRKITVNPIIRGGKQKGYKLVAEIHGAPGNTEDDYHEMRVGIFDKKGKCVGDAFFTVDEETGEPKIYITLDGDGTGDPGLAVFPLRSGKDSVEPC